jgi:hypothetical protein
MAGKMTSLTLPFLVHLPCVFPAFIRLFFAIFMALLRIISVFVNMRLFSQYLALKMIMGTF